MAALRAFAPTSQLLFGTDFPIEPIETTVTQIPGLKLPADVQHALDRGKPSVCGPSSRPEPFKDEGRDGMIAIVPR